MQLYQKNKLRAIINGNNAIGKEIAKILPALKEWLSALNGKRMFTANGDMRADARKILPELPDGKVRLWINKSYDSIYIKGRVNVSIEGSTYCHIYEIFVGRIENEGSLKGAFRMRENIIPPATDNDADSIIMYIEDAERVLETARQEAERILEKAGASKFASINADVRVHI